MIRLIRRRLIIPRGDTGSFSIPALHSITDNQVAVFSIFDPLTKTCVLEKEITLTGDADLITVEIEHKDTVNLQAKKYKWDLRIYTNPERDDDEKIINADEIDSYYSAFSLPVCEIREVAQNV